MSRLLWGVVALLAVPIAVVLVPAGLGGQVSDQAFAHIVTPTGTPGPPMVHLEIDADITNGSGPCNPVDATVPIEAEVGNAHQVAVCLTSSSMPPAGFQFDLVYDPTLSTCENESCPTGTCFDDNPDANLGTTTFSSPTLGSDADWDCSVSGMMEPVCDRDGEDGRAFMTCLCPGLGCGTLPVGADVSTPIAVVTFEVASLGVDNFKLEDVALYDENGAPILQCDGSGPCYGATAVFRSAIGGIAEYAELEPGTAATSSGSPAPLSTALAGLAAGGAVLLMTGAWYASRRRRAA